MTKEEEKNLQEIWSEVMWISIDRYISDNGLPETKEHDHLYGDALDEYLEKNGGPNFEDCRVIIED